MNYLLDVILCSGVVVLELIGVFALAMLVQGVVYWSTGFSIYNWFKKVLF